MNLTYLLTTEPRINKLLKQAQSRRLSGQRKYEAYEQYRGELERLAGWGAEKPELRTEEAYQTAIQALGKALKV